MANSSTASLDSDPTMTIHMHDEVPVPVTDCPPERTGLPDEDDLYDRVTPLIDAPQQRDTPLLPGSLPVAGKARGMLTVLTGLCAGRVVVVDQEPVTIGRAADADLAVDETGVSRRHARISLAPAGGFYVEDLGSRNGTFVGGGRVGVALLKEGDLLQLGPHLRMRFALVDSVEESLYRQLYDASVHDPLTHVFNRKYLADLMLAEIARTRRSMGDMSALMIDVDALKRVNDSFGHLAGDRALCTVAARILRALRVEDVLARYGGDEFVVLAAGTTLRDAAHLAERVRRAVEGLHMSARGHDVRITTSIGVASLSELAASDDPGTALLAMADARMYEAKSTGGNRAHTTSATKSADEAAAWVVPHLVDVEVTQVVGR
jgi:diguanylate cyclase (GGDEF)-like protein